VRRRAQLRPSPSRGLGGAGTKSPAFEDEMTQIINPIGAANATTPTLDAAAGAPAHTPPPTDPADLRLVIEDDQAAGCFVYKTVDWRTGEVVAQIPREQILRMREAPAYLAGDVIKTRV
jgi:flagellar protein FlaG